ncbi:hypothetical protein ACWDR1_32015 [Streptosporangium sandarakinum]
MFDSPIDLSDLPGYQAAARVAFLGRCSTRDNQDPRSSIAGQLAEASTLLAPGEVFTAHFWDVESGMLGEVEGLEISLAGAVEKISQLDEMTEPSVVHLGVPAFSHISGRTT